MKPHPVLLTWILCLVLRLRGGGYPQYILKKAAELELNNDNENLKSIFFLLYDKILNYWFPPTDGYSICPHWSHPDTADFIISFVIEHHQHPFLLVDIKPPSDFLLASGHGLAFAELIQHLHEIGPNNQHADQLYAISAIGKRWRACYTLKGTDSTGCQPVKGVAAVNSLKSDCPECWNPDITSDTSWVALQSIVETIKGYVADLD
jgi:hypothetical protein